MEILSIIAGLVVPIGRWIAELIEAGNTPEQAAEIVRRDFEDRRAEIAANRAGVDAALDAKHGGGG